MTIRPDELTEHERLERRAARTATVAFVVAIAAGAVAAAGYATSRATLLGAGLAVALLAIGVGLVAWSRSLGVNEREEQQREPMTLTVEGEHAIHDELGDTRRRFGRRPALVWLFGGSLVSAFIAFVGPVGSLGPKPRRERGRTSWKPGVRLVTIDGVAVAASTSSEGELVTVFPDGAIGVDDSQVVLLKLPVDQLSERTRSAGTADGWVAYSKICTHAGCSVGLFGIDTNAPQLLTQLVCPCHQSVFDPLDAARPAGGPATRPLPQLSLDVDADGYLIARADFDRPVGPLAWDEA